MAEADALQRQHTAASAYLRTYATRALKEAVGQLLRQRGGGGEQLVVCDGCQCLLKHMCDTCSFKKTQFVTQGTPAAAAWRQWGAAGHLGHTQRDM